MAGFFSSKGEAKRNGWGGELKEGFNDKVLKKRGLKLWYYIPNKYAFIKPCECCLDKYNCKKDE